MAAVSYGSLTLRELKNELKRRNARTSGRKAELVERLEAYERNDNFGQQPDIVPDGLTLTLPPAVSYVDLKKSITLPFMDISAVTHYGELYMTEIKHTLYENRFLRYLKVSSETSTGYFLRGEVRAEMKKKVSYIVDLVISPNSEILQAQCECAAGAAPTAHCKHVFVVLRAIVDFTKSSTFLCETSKTQELQTFHRPKPFVGSPIKASSLPQQSQRLSETIFDPRPTKFVREESYPDFFRNRVINFKSNNPSSSHIPVEQMYLPANIVALEQDHDYGSMLMCDDFLEKLGVAKMSKERAISIESRTQEQANSQEWHNERRIRISSSRFGTICKLTDRADKVKLCDSITSPKPFTSKPTAHGRRFESVAIRQYEALNGVQVKKCGLVINPDYPFLASSPDGLVGNDIVIEVKCPYVARDKLISSTTVPFLEEVDGILFLKRNHSYYYQVQGQLLITNRLLCHFIIYTFREVKILQILIDYTFIDEMVTKLRHFYDHHLKHAVLKKYFYLQ